MIAIMSQEQFYDASVYLPSQTALGQPLIAIDGRVAVCHPFSEDDQLYLQERGAVLCDELPGDFVLLSGCVNDG